MNTLTKILGNGWDFARTPQTIILVTGIIFVFYLAWLAKGLFYSAWNKRGDEGKRKGRNKK